VVREAAEAGPCAEAEEVEEVHREEEADLAPAEEVAAEEVGVSPGVEVAASLPEAEEGLLLGDAGTDTPWTPSWISGVFGSVCMVF
jgi:hypothetical protein